MLKAGVMLCGHPEDRASAPEKRGKLQKTAGRGLCAPGHSERMQPWETEGSRPSMELVAQKEGWGPEREGEQRDNTATV